MKTLTKIITVLIAITVLAFFAGCENQTPLTPAELSSGKNASLSNSFIPLKFGDHGMSFNKEISVSEYITVASGGILTLEYGASSGGAGSYLYGVSEDDPYEIYQIDPLDPEVPVPVGQLAFKTRAIALQPKIEPGIPPTGTPEELRVLFVAMDAYGLSQQEQIRIQLLESWGFTVTPISAGAAQSEFDDAASDNDVAFIFEGIDAAQLNSKLVQTQMGIVSEEVQLIDEFGIGSNYVWAYSRDLYILNSSHYITSDFPSGVASMFTSNLAVPYFSQYLAPGLESLGRYSTYYGPSLVVLEQGAALYGGGTAAGRRVQLPMGNYGYDFSLLSSDGKLVLRRSLEWAAHKEGFQPAGGSNATDGGLIYYVAKDKVNDIYRVAYWDPATNNNTILPMGSTIQPAEKLTFGPDGKLYAGSRDNKDEIYTINTTTGEWTLLTTLNQDLSEKGDLAFGPDGTLYNVDDKKLYRVDLSAGTVVYIAQLPTDKITGIGFVRNGLCYISKENGDLYTLNPSSGAGTYLGDTGTSKLHDLSSFAGAAELSYASATLTITPGSISEDAEVALSMETSEILGGVSVTFEPHGVVFNQPAILNIEAHGVDFSGINPNNVDVYYDNQQTGQWELMQRDDIIIDANAGTVQVVNARLPHFSRYAIGAE